MTRFKPGPDSWPPKSSELLSHSPDPSVGLADRASRGWYFRGYVPHFDAPGRVQHLTFHLADSLPDRALNRMQKEWASKPEPLRKLEKRKHIHRLLDAGFGSCVLRHPLAAECVEESLVYGDGDRYFLLAWVIMPNHVHVLIEQKQRVPLGQIVASWKRHTTKVLKQRGFVGSPQGKEGRRPFWQRDYWDRYIRNEHHLRNAKTYIEANPVMAGLARCPSEWRWSSAWFGANSSKR